MSSSIAKTLTFVAASPRPIGVEVEVHPGPPAFSVVGLPDRAIAEARERLRAAIAKSGFRFPSSRVLVKVAPNGGKASSGGGFDLPIAAALLAASSQLRWDALSRLALVGELNLDGSTRPVAGIPLIARSAADFGADALLIPARLVEVALASLTPGVDVIPVESLAQLPSLAAEWPPAIGEINYCMVSGTLRAPPEPGKSPRGDRVMLLRLALLVYDPGGSRRGRERRRSLARRHCRLAGEGQSVAAGLGSFADGTRPHSLLKRS